MKETLEEKDTLPAPVCRCGELWGWGGDGELIW